MIFRDKGSKEIATPTISIATPMKYQKHFI